MPVAILDAILNNNKCSMLTDTNYLLYDLKIETSKNISYRSSVSRIAITFVHLYYNFKSIYSDTYFAYAIYRSRNVHYDTVALSCPLLTVDNT